MVQGMRFLSKKGFNPQNNTNRKQVWEAQQQSKLEKERLRKRREQFKREQEDAELELATRGEIGGSQAQLRFMYDAPPGMKNKTSDDATRTATSTSSDNNNRGSLDGKTDANDLSQVKPGDDAAAVAFRQMLAAAAASNEPEEEQPLFGDDEQDPAETFRFTPSLQGSMVEADSRYNNANSSNSGDPNGNNNNNTTKKNPPVQDSRSALEKEVGRKNRSTQNNLSYEQQIERFPQLKNAPMAVKRGDNNSNNSGEASSSTMMVHFKPLGSQILHVRCLACGIWGHAKGDRECKKSGWNPFAMPASSSSILPPASRPKSGDLEEGLKEDPRKQRKRHRRYDSESDESNRRRHNRSSRHRKRRDYGSDSEYSSHDRRKHKNRRKHRYKEHYGDSSEYDTSNSDPSSEDSSKLKRRNDDRYDSEDERRRHRKKSHEKHRDRKSSKKKSKRYESSSSHRKKKKKRRHSSP